MLLPTGLAPAKLMGLPCSGTGTRNCPLAVLMSKNRLFCPSAWLSVVVDGTLDLGDVFPLGCMTIGVCGRGLSVGKLGWAIRGGIA